MSEYQYYEWQTIDRPLSEREQAEVNELSSHMEVVTATQAVVTYSWGDFKHDPQKVLLKYFDAFLYDSNFGSRTLMFRLPHNLVDVEAIQPYLYDDVTVLEKHGKYFVLEFRLDEDPGFSDWVESGRILGQLTPLRDQLLQGDLRVLYLAWLRAAARNDPEDEAEELEPPVPAGLKKLNAGLQAFAEFFEIDSHLISAAAKASPQTEATPEPDLEAALARLSREECETYLKQILRGEASAVLSLKKRLTELRGGKPASSAPPTRARGELSEQAEQIKAEAQRQARKTAERQRLQRLEKLAQDEDTTWAHIENLLGEKRAAAYDEATRLLVELRDMADYKQRQPRFSERFRSILERYGKSVAFKDRLKRVGLL